MPRPQQCPLPSGYSDDNPLMPKALDKQKAFNLLHPGQIQIFIKTVSNPSPIAIILSPDSKVKSLKNKIEEQLKVPVKDQRLLYSGAQLENERTLADYELESQSTILLGPSHSPFPSSLISHNSMYRHSHASDRTGSSEGEAPAACCH